MACDLTNRVIHFTQNERSQNQYLELEKLFSICGFQGKSCTNSRELKEILAQAPDVSASLDKWLVYSKWLHDNHKEILVYISEH